MIKSKDEVEMRYFHYLRATLAAKRRKEKRLMKQLKGIWDDIDEINRELGNPVESETEQGGVKND